MAEDWDLYAVLRSCKTAAADTSRYAAVERSGSDNKNDRNCGSFREDPLACLASLTFEEEDDPFTFKIGSLHDSYKPFLTKVDPTTNQGMDPCSSSSVHGGSSGQLHHHHHHHHHHRLQQHQQEPQTTTTVGVGSPLTPTSAPMFSFGGFGNQQQPPSQQLQQRVQSQAQTPRSRKRKNQMKRTVCHVTGDNLSSDPWAWRKYGQKPIKGSTYPRNYYRCSSSKGCSARKQLERSNTDPNVFIVTYNGEHTHPKPTHRNSLAGSTRNKVSTIQNTAATTITAKDSAAETMHAACSSPRSATSLSPTTPLSAPEDAAASVHNPGEDESVGMALGSESDYYDDDLLIPNVHVDEDLFEGLEELVGSAGSGIG
ncbi:putative WRKY transcription factor 27 [Hibiscus syriacus]|uniref:WRKY transcription factor 27 n=1 Tax=Hibiscus syriacus TaxID=106335 RepID=A0A6A3AMR6_HIBSY|nr:probable WRKY transcription factor 27 [Hibiscus syriacus]KAE8704697.1 putative WRKY transcription factor 27 [Hibiscus syriacus]